MSLTSSSSSDLGRFPLNVRPATPASPGRPPRLSCNEDVLWWLHLDDQQQDGPSHHEHTRVSFWGMGPSRTLVLPRKTTFEQELDQRVPLVERPPIQQRERLPPILDPNRYAYCRKSELMEERRQRHVKHVRTAQQHALCAQVQTQMLMKKRTHERQQVLSLG